MILLRQKRCFNILLLLISVCFFFTACQPTPTEDVIVNQGDKEELGSLVATFSPYAAPAHLTMDSTEKNGCIFSAEAEVIVPESAGYAVKLVERFKLDGETLLAWAKVLVGDVPLLRPAEKTKQDYQKDIQEYMGQLAAAAESGNTAEQEYVNSILEGLQEKYQQAPEKSAIRPFSPADYTDGERMEIITEQSSNVIISCYKNGQEFYYRREGISIYPIGLYPAQESIVGENDRKWKRYLDAVFEYEQGAAILRANQILADMGLEQLTVSKIEKCCFIRNDALASVGWLAYCTRSSNGLNGHFQWQTEGSMGASPVIGAPWEPEYALLGVDAEGVAYMDAVGLGEEVQTLVSNTELLPFDKLCERARDLLLRMYPADEGERCLIRMEEMELSVALISKKDDSVHGLLIPIWYITYHYAYHSGNNNVTSETMYVSLDARDGAYIEPYMLTTQLSSYG